MKQFTLIALTSLLFCSSPLAAEKIFEISSKDYEIYGVSIGDKYETVISKLGSPQKEIVNSDPATDGNPTEMYYDGINIYLNGNEVLNIEITKPGHQVKGIEVGDNIDKVYKLLGENKYLQCEKKCLKYSVRAENGALTDAYLLFYIVDDRVSKIIFWFDYT